MRQNVRLVAACRAGSAVKWNGQDAKGSTLQTRILSDNDSQSGARPEADVLLLSWPCCCSHHQSHKLLPVETPSDRSEAQRDSRNLRGRATRQSQHCAKETAGETASTRF